MSGMNKKPKTSACESRDILEACDQPFVTLEVGERQLVVHRSVLVAKSPVFSAMLTHDTVEAKTGRIAIVDIEPKVLQELVLFMYKDSAPQLCSMAPQLLVAADKYCMPDLKAKCEQQLLLNLSVENVVSSALLALRCSCSRLKETAGWFLHANLTKVMDTEGWAEAVRKNPEEFVELSRLLAATRNTCQEEMNRKLHEAVINNRLAEIEELLNTGAYVGARDVNGRTVLHYAASTDIIKCLLEAGAVVNARDRWHRTPLHAAIQRGSTDVASQLVAASSNVNAADVYGDTPLHLAAQFGSRDLIVKLLKMGADKEAKNNLRETPLDVAERYKNDFLVTTLSVSGSAKMSEMSKNPKTLACDFAALLEPRDDVCVTLVVEESQLVAHKSVLVAKSPVFAEMVASNKTEASSGHIVITGVKPKVLQQLVLFMYTDSAPQLCSMASELLVAADKYRVLDLKAQCELQLVLDLSLENVVSSALLTLRHSCPHLKETAWCLLQGNLTKVMDTEGWAEAARNNPEEFVELCHLLASTRSASQEEMNCKLLVAAKNGRSLNKLLATGAYVGAQDVHGTTALHFAAGHGHDENVKFLLEAGADVKARDMHGRTALHYASATEDQHSADTRQHFAFSSSVCFSSTQTDANEQKSTTQSLLQAGACVDVRDKWLQTPLHSAVQGNNLKVVNELLAASSDVNTADVYGNTPLHLATLSGNTNVVKALLDAGARKDAKNNLRETPLDVAKKYNKNQLLAMLR